MFGHRTSFAVLTLAFVATATISRPGIAPADEPPAFARSTIDLGCVVSDIEAAVRFYREAIGFKELDGFHVPADFATRAGLTDNQPLNIRVMVLGDDDSATKLKLMQLPGVPSQRSNNETIHSQLGYSYLTIFVTDMDAAVVRLEKADVKILAQGPAELPADLGRGVYLTVIRDPDGNLVELVGPRG